jgi:hypothetical protein
MVRRPARRDLRHMASTRLEVFDLYEACYDNRQA